MKEKNTNVKHNLGKKIYFKSYKLWKATWEEGTIDKRIDKMLYLIKYPKCVIKRYLNQIKKIYSGRISMQGGTLTVIYDMFDVSMSQSVQQNRSNKRKRIPMGTMEIDPKRQKYVVQGGHQISKRRCFC